MFAFIYLDLDINVDLVFRFRLEPLILISDLGFDLDLGF